MNVKRFVALFLRWALVLPGLCVLLSLFTAAAFATPTANAFVRVVHASPDAGPVDVFVDNNALLKNFAFGSVTPYQPLAAGAHVVKVAPAGKGEGAAVITQSVNLTGGTYTTAAALGSKANGFTVKAFEDNNTLPANQAKVRVYHLSPNAGPVDVATGGKTVITGLTYPNVSDYLTVPAGSYTFDVTATHPQMVATTTTQESAVTAEQPMATGTATTTSPSATGTATATVTVPATLTAGNVYSVFALGLYKGTPALKFNVASEKGTPGK